MTRQVYTARYAIRPECFSIPMMPLPATGPFAVINPNIPVQSYITPAPMMQIQDGAAATSQSLSISTATDTSTSDEQTVTVLQSGLLALSGAWSISYIGGYAVDNNLEKLVGLLEAKEYTHAMWWPNAETASLWALKDYVDRFCRVYDLRDIDLHRPEQLLQIGEQYDDPRFEEGSMEISENAALRSLREHGLL